MSLAMLAPLCRNALENGFVLFLNLGTAILPPRIALITSQYLVMRQRKIVLENLSQPGRLRRQKLLKFFLWAFVGHEPPSRVSYGLPLPQIDFSQPSIAVYRTQ